MSLCLCGRKNYSHEPDNHTGLRHQVYTKNELILNKYLYKNLLFIEKIQFIAHSREICRTPNQDESRFGMPSQIEFFCNFAPKINTLQMRHISLFLLFCSLFLIQTGFSQETKADKKARKKTERKARDKYLSSGLGVVKMSAKDYATSPLLYSGATGFGNLEYLIHSDKLIKTFGLSLGSGTLKTDKDDHPNLTRSSATGIYFDFRFLYLMKIMKLADDRVTWYIGPGLDFTNYSRINFKYGNSAYNYEYMLDLGFASRIEFPFGYKSKDCKFLGMKFHRRDRQYRLSWQLYLPVIGTIYRPGYVTITNFSNPDEPVFNANNLSTVVFKFLQISSNVELFYLLHNGNMLKLSYLWEYYQFNPGFNKVQGALNGVYFSFIFKFNEK